VKTKSPILAAILSIVIVGLGQIYLGLWMRGIILFIAAIAVAFFTAGTFIFFPMFIACGDAYICARKMNAGASLEEVNNRAFNF
jgi:TM2 domain-containing membrane protein YozV